MIFLHKIIFIVYYFRESSWQERLFYQYPQRFVKFDPSHMKYLIPGKLANDPDDLSYTIKVVSGGKLEFTMKFLKHLFFLIYISK